jgi:hypothetical protein
VLFTITLWQKNSFLSVSEGRKRRIFSCGLALFFWSINPPSGSYCILPINTDNVFKEDQSNRPEFIEDYFDIAYSFSLKG